MAISTMYNILQLISFKQYTMCAARVYSYNFPRYVVFPTGVKGLKILLRKNVYLCLFVDKARALHFIFKTESA